MTDEQPVEQKESSFDYLIKKFGYKDRKHFYRDLIFDIILLSLIGFFANEALNRWELCPVSTTELLSNFSVNISRP